MLNAYLDIQPEVCRRAGRRRSRWWPGSCIISPACPIRRTWRRRRQVEQVVRDNGAVPATIAIIDGRLRWVWMRGRWRRWAGPVIPPPSAAAATFPSCWPTRGLGATTVASTMIIAAMAGIRVFATGGIGSVHRGAQETFDISADLQGICPDPGGRGLRRSQVDPRHRSDPGVPGDPGGAGDRLPDRGAARLLHPGGGLGGLPPGEPGGHRRALRLKWELGLAGGRRGGHPIPTQFAMPKADIDAAIAQALREADEQG